MSNIVLIPPGSEYPENLSSQVDRTDLRLITELETSPKQTHSTIATKLHLSRATIQSRLQKLYRSGVIRTVAVADPIAIGNKTCVLIGIKSLPGQMVAIAKQLSQSIHIQHLMLCLGRFDILAFATFKKRPDFLDFLVNVVGTIPGVNHIETMLTLKHVKLMGPLLASSNGFYLENTAETCLDDLDIALLRELETDATQNTRELARKVGTSQSTAVRKIQRLQEDGVVRVMTLVDPLALGYEGVASIGIRCNAASVNEAANMVAAYRNVQTVAICTGRYDIVTWVFFRELGDLSEFVTSDLSQIPGLQFTETMTNLKMVKTSYKSVNNEG